MNPDIFGREYYQVEIDQYGRKKYYTEEPYHENISTRDQREIIELLSNRTYREFIIRCLGYDDHRFENECETLSKKNYDLELQVEKLKADLQTIQKKLNESEKIFNVKEMAKNTISSKLKQLQSIQFENSDRLVFITIPCDYKKEEKELFISEINKILNKVETNISVIFTSKEVQVKKIKNEELLSFGLKKVTAMKVVSL